MTDGYDPQELEVKWQRRWADEGTYEVENDDPRDHAYVLCMYPYPSGPAHMGHVRNYTFGDLLVRYRTMTGHAVLSPIGFDAFGLPAENAAIRSGEHPRLYVDARIEELSASLRRLGAVYDWRRSVRSHDPDYIRWTQWIFLRLLEADLAYRAEAPVNWCPGCQTVLANEQVLADGTCERSGDDVERRNLEQWFFRITEYAQQLLDDLDDLVWPERVKTMHESMVAAKEQFEMVPAEALVDLAQFSSPALAAQAARLSTSLRIPDRANPPINVVISNVPGPRQPLYLAGATLKNYYPVSTIADGMGLNITVHSYLDVLDIGIVACRELVPDLEFLVDLHVEEIQTLFEAAGLER